MEQANMRSTIFALSSGQPPSGVAVIRVSGPKTRFVLETIAGGVPPERRTVLRPLVEPVSGEAVDRGLVVFFEGPRSFTGEDSAEFHIHGGRAVVAAFLRLLSGLPGLVAAEAGAFTRRAFENGRMDLTSVEGLSDLVAAETEEQRRQALRLADGAFDRKAASWREAILDACAAIEADLDFSEEEGDVPGSIAERADDIVDGLRTDILAVLSDGPRGEIVRDGYHVALAGPPNAGKSSLINALARRDVAIVTTTPGTTRDVLEVALDLGGMRVVLADTAGLREAGDDIEAEGIRRARARASAADLVLWLSDDDASPPGDLGGRVVRIATKSDLSVRSDKDTAPRSGGFPDRISVVTGDGLADLERALADSASSIAGDTVLVTRERHRSHLAAMAAELEAFGTVRSPELKAEVLRRAGDELGKLTGRIDVEDVLGVIFSTFCIGK